VCRSQSETDMTVNVSAGYANLNGKTAYWDEDNTMALETASGVYNRIDTIVLRRNNTDRVISIEVVTGVASANPQPTPPVRNGDIYELVLAQIVVGVGVTEITPAKITDTRILGQKRPMKISAYNTAVEDAFTGVLSVVAVTI